MIIFKFFKYRREKSQPVATADLLPLRALEDSLALTKVLLARRRRRRLVGGLGGKKKNERNDEGEAGLFYFSGEKRRRAPAMELVLAACLTFTHWHVTPFTLNRNVNFFFFSSSSNSRRRQLSASFLFLVSLFFVSKIWLSWAYLAYYCGQQKIKARLLLFCERKNFIFQLFSG